MDNVKELPPQSIEAEQSVLGAIMVDSDSLLRAADIIELQDFYRESHQVLYGAFLDLYDLGEPIDLITVSKHLKDKKKLVKVGGQTYLAQLATMTPTSANIKYHAQIIKKLAIQRRVQKWAYNIIVEGYDNPPDIQKWFGKIERGLTEVSQNTKERRSPYMQEILQSIDERWEKVRQGRKTHVKTDQDLAEIVPGFYPTHVWVLRGYTSFGKSSLMNQWIVDAKTADADSEILVFSAEDSREEKTMMLLGNIADVPKRRLITGDIQGYEEELAEARRKLLDWNVKIYDDVRTVDELRLKAKKHKKEKGHLDIVCVDYIQKFKGRDGDKFYETMSDVSHRLFDLAGELECTVIELSQVTASAMQKGSVGIQAKGAGEITEDAHIVMNLQRSKAVGRERDIDLIVEKNRAFGVTGVVPYTFSDKWTHIIRRFM